MLVPLRDAFQAADEYLQHYSTFPDGLADLIFGQRGLLERHGHMCEQYKRHYASKAHHKALLKFVYEKEITFHRGYDWAYTDLIKGREGENLQKAEL